MLPVRQARIVHRRLPQEGREQGQLQAQVEDGWQVPVKVQPQEQAQGRATIEEEGEPRQGLSDGWRHASPVVSDEVECADCPIFLADLAMFKEKHASKCEELDVLRVEVVELKSRPALLGACTSCPLLHVKIYEMHAYIVSLVAKLKEPIPTSCSTCELHALKNLELAHYVDSLQDENDELRKFMGWLSGHEP
jgi:Pyruvate/2-oxoacid:ferredoxin oxidoreductase delta subunit